MRLGGPEVVVPEPHRVGVVQDRRDLLVLAQRAQLRLGLERVARPAAGRHRARRDRAPRRWRRSAATPPASRVTGRAFAARRGQQPELARLVVGIAFGIRSRGDEQDVAARGERRARPRPSPIASAASASRSRRSAPTTATARTRCRPSSASRPSARRGCRPARARAPRRAAGRCSRRASRRGWMPCAPR